MGWRPASIEEVKRITEGDLASFDQEQTAAFQVHRVDPYLAPIKRSGKIERVVVVAQKGDVVIYWEDIEEGFGLSVIGVDGTILEHDCSQDDLGRALHRLMGRHS